MLSSVALSPMLCPSGLKLNFIIVNVYKDCWFDTKIHHFQLENRVSELVREKEDMEGRLEDEQDEIEELLEKQRAHISHTSSLQTQLNEATIQIGELEESKISLESRVGLCTVCVCGCVWVCVSVCGCVCVKVNN